MSLHTAAKYLESHGRGKDDQLVHMSSNEVKGLQALAKAHGGSLSINPKTGLAEAGFLDNILPVVLGVGLNAAFPGLGALATAGIVGGGTAIMTGDINKGLMAGLGAYGGAGIGEGLSAAGGTQAGMVEGAKALGTTPEAIATPQGMTNALTSPSTYEGADIMTSHVIDPAKQQAFVDAYTKGAATPETFGERLSQMGQGLKQINTEEGRAGIYNALPTGTLPATGLSLSNALTPQPKVPGAPEEDPRYKGSPYRYNLAKNFTGSTPVQPNPYYRPSGLGYAAGGDVMMYAGGSFDDEPRGDDQGFGFAAGGVPGYANRGLARAPQDLKMGEGIARDTDDDTAGLNTFDAAKKRMAKINKAANMPKNYAAQMPQVRGLGELAVAQGGSIGGYSDGGRMLKGPGDGMSDSIPATIGRKQPARLADGEFVVPADVVSHLGNGSTDAGAKRLYGMMDKVRQARTGKKKQAPAVKAEKYLPA